jgi:hypothetical protein
VSRLRLSPDKERVQYLLNEADSQFLQAANKGVGLRSCLEDLNQSFWFALTCRFPFPWSVKLN